MLRTKEKIYAIVRFLLSIKQSYVGSLSRYDTSILSHSKKLTWEVHYCSSYIVIFTYYRRLETKILFSRKEDFLFKTLGSLTAKHR